MSVRRTKIVATLGPASNSPEMLEQLILAGLDVARLNFSHGTPDEHKARAKLVRDIAAKHGRFVALLGDLQGPKIRIAKFANKRIELKIGDRFTFSTSHPLTEGTQEIVGNLACRVLSKSVSTPSSRNLLFSSYRLLVDLMYILYHIKCTLSSFLLT